MTTSILPTTTTTSHAVSRSDELLSCARTALKILKKRSVDNDTAWYHSIQATDLQLHSQANKNENPKLDSGLQLLTTISQNLDHLQQLVRRRGHTNDPKTEIANSVQHLQQTLVQLTTLIQTLELHRGQRQRHVKNVQAWFQGEITKYKEQLSSILKVRAQVVAEQAKRRQKFTTSNTMSNVHIPPPPPPPLPVVHRQPPPVIPKPPPQAQHQSNGTQPLSSQSSNRLQPPPPSTTTTAAATTPPPASNGSSNGHNHNNNTPQTPAPNYYGSYQPYGAGGSVGYGGGGMRNRKTTNATNATMVQEQLPQHNTSTQRRNEARLAEQSLAELGTVFTNFSTILSTQSEVLESIEDDVEAAHTHVEAGQNEITILYEIRKGNRPLILKTFVLLNFLIVFMKLYAK